MKKLLLLLCALLTGVSGAWADVTATWTSGVDFLTQTSTGNYTTGWFSMVMPASGTITSLKINLGVGSNIRKDAYLAISKDLKSETGSFSSSDFVAISSGTCGTTDYEVTMTFNSGDLIGGNTYYFYWVTVNEGSYTTVQQRYCVGNQNVGVQMSIGSVGTTSAQSTEYNPRFSCTMVLKDNVYYRIRALYPDPICYLYSSSSNEDKIFKRQLANAPTSLVTASRYVWKVTMGDNGVIIQNAGNSHYMAKINGSAAGETYLSATAVDDAEKFTLVANNPARNYNYSGYVALKSMTNENSYLNCYTTNNDFVGSFTATDNKSGQFMFQQVKKVTFSTAVIIGDSRVTDIYVACDGSDSFTLPADFTYTISGTRYSASEAVGVIKAPGTEDVTVNVNIVEDQKYYRLLQQWTSTPFYLYANSSNADKLWKTNSTDNLVNANFAWQAQRSGDNWKFYNMGGERWIAKANSNSSDGSNQGIIPLSATTTEAAESFTLAAAESCGYPPSDYSTVNYVSLKSNTLNTYLNSFSSNTDYVGWHNAVHAGYYFKFLPLKKVTFSRAVAVNDGSQVTTIYVATDGSDSFTLPINYTYTISETKYYAQGAVEAILAAGTENINVTVEENEEKVTVKYNLVFGGRTIKEVSDVEATVSSDAADLVPSSFINNFVTLSYSPEVISNATTEVNVTATWNGPFNIASAYNAATQNIWYVVDMHSSENDYTWQYDSGSGEIQTPIIAKNAYGSLTDNNLWCFVGNPYDGFKIYNKAAGNTMTIRKENTGNTVSYMSTTDDHNQFKLFTSRALNGAYCFKLDGDDYYLNKQGSAQNGWKLCGWNDNDNGSSCRFLAPGTYHLAVMNTWVLDAPIGAVGTKSYITSESQRESMLEARTNITNDPFCVVGQFTMMNTILNPVRDSETIALADGYYRVVSAIPGFNNAAAWYYNPSVSADHITWAQDATKTENQVNSIFNIKASTTDGKWNIYSPNAQQSIICDNTQFQAQTGALGETAGDVTIENIASSVQYTLKINYQTVHCNNHQSGDGKSGTLINYNANEVGQASAWYIVKVDELDLTLTQVGDYTYATLCLPFAVTITGADAYTLALNGAKTGLTMTALDGGVVPAGTPVLLRGTSTSATAAIAADAATAKEPLNTTALTGVYVNTPVSSGGTDYFLGYNTDNKIGFYHWKGTELKANRAYLEASKLSSPAGVKGFALNFDLATAIDALNAQEASKGSIYNLAGQRVNKAQKGIYIVNGKKVAVK